jgi:hypothetical protein
LKHVRRGIASAWGVQRLLSCLFVLAGTLAFVLLLLELFSGHGNLSHTAKHTPGWSCLEPRDILSGHDLLNNSTQNQVLADIKKHKPHLVTLAPPCGPWSSLQNLY